MNDDHAHQNDVPDIRPIVARLREIERKCASMGTRNEEFPLVQQRVASIIARLEAGEEPSGDKLRFGQIARELFPVAHVFESVGFMSVGREIAHIERALRELDPEAAQAPEKPLPAATRISSAAVQPAPVAEPPPVADETPPKSRVPVPVIVGVLLLLAAIAVAVSIVLGIGPAARLAGRREPLPPTPTALPVPPATAVVVAEPSPTATPRATASPVPRGRLDDELSQARLALARGDVEAALSHLSAAALVDRTDDDVVEVATSLVERFVAAANGAADGGDWEEASRRLERAQRLAMRFGLDDGPVKRAERRIAAMERFRLIDPRDTQSIRAATGRRVDVRLRDGQVRTGWIESVSGPTLLLEVVRELGGGGLHYTEELALDDITVIKIYEE